MSAVSTVVRTGIFNGAYKVGETNTLWGTYKTWAKEQPEGVVWVHGSGENGMTVVMTFDYRTFMKSLGKIATTVSGDYGFQTWGNDIAIDAIDKMIDYMIAEYGVVEPVIISGGSMGGCNSLNYVRAHPERVKAAALVIPLIEINYIYGISPGDVNSAYPPTGWSQATYGPTHNPITFAPTLDPDIPIKMWCASDDSLCPFAYAQAFAEASPNTELVNLGPGGHSSATVAKAFPLMLDWIKGIIQG